MWQRLQEKMPGVHPRGQHGLSTMLVLRSPPQVLGQTFGNVLTELTNSSQPLLLSGGETDYRTPFRKEEGSTSIASSI